MAAILGPASLLPKCSQLRRLWKYFHRHSAHIGQELEIHYRWHPLCGRKVRYRDCEQRGSGCVVHLDDGSGAITVVPAWMLDPVVCVSMKLGEPRVAVAALRELHDLLIERGLRESSSNDSTFVQEECNEFDVHSHSTAATGVISSPASEQPGLHLSPTFRDERIAESASIELSGKSADVGRRLRNSGGQR
jgi:hypothetical protein